jgi:hypothetical protein
VLAKADAARLARVRPSHPGSEEAADRDRQNSYSLVRYRFDRTSSISDRNAVDQTFEMPGDCVHVLELTGSAQIAISLGKNRFIPVREGDTLTRSFSKLVVRFLGDRSTSPSSTYTQNYGTTEALLLVSYGRVLTREPKRNDFSSGFPARRVTCDATGTDVLNAFRTSGLFFEQGGSMKGGGTVIMKNLSPSEPIFIFYGVPGSFHYGTGSVPNENYAFQIDPGESLTLECSSRMLQAQSSNAEDVADLFSSIIAASPSSAATLNVMLSRWNPDASELETVFPYGGSVGLTE